VEEGISLTFGEECLINEATIFNQSCCMAKQKREINQLDNALAIGKALIISFTKDL